MLTARWESRLICLSFAARGVSRIGEKNVVLLGVWHDCKRVFGFDYEV
jgi:hypothetical protein